MSWCSDPINFTDNYLPTVFGGYRVLDNWGLDLFSKDKLGQLSNDEAIKYLVTYRRDNKDLYKSGCEIPSVSYDFSFMIKDCPDGKYLLNVLADTFIEAIIKNQQVYELELSTRVDYTTNTEIKKRKYNCRLDSTQVIDRVDTFSQEFEANNNKINYLTNGITLKFVINQLNH
ncbi:MAG: hypothetical protein ACRCZ2_10050 [Fusobacteriaceae bacterium]